MYSNETRTDSAGSAISPDRQARIDRLRSKAPAPVPAAAVGGRAPVEKEHVVRHRGSRQVPVPLALLEDGRLNGWARTLGAWISSRPDDWKFYPRHIMEQLAMGRDTYLKARRELIESGWIETTLTRDGGRYGSPEWTFCADNKPPAPATKPKKGKGKATGVGKPDSGAAGVGPAAD